MRREGKGDKGGWAKGWHRKNVYCNRQSTRLSATLCIHLHRRKLSATNSEAHLALTLVANEKTASKIASWLRHLRHPIYHTLLYRRLHAIHCSLSANGWRERERERSRHLAVYCASTLQWLPLVTVEQTNERSTCHYTDQLVHHQRPNTSHGFVVGPRFTLCTCRPRSVSSIVQSATHVELGIYRHPDALLLVATYVRITQWLGWLLQQL